MNNKNIKKLDCKNVLNRLNELIKNYKEPYNIFSIANGASIFQWYSGTISLLQLNKMKLFLETASRYGFNGRVGFIVGIEGSSHGMWAYEESFDGNTPHGKFLYRSFSPDIIYWQYYDGNTCVPSGVDHYYDCDTFDKLKEIANLKEKE